MKLPKGKYIIVEIIPTAISPQKGDIVEMTALLVNGLVIEDRFNYRLNKRLVALPDFLKMTDYDEDSFIYKDSTKEILDEFNKWSKKYPLLIIDNLYTNNFLESISNKKESIFKYMDKEYNDTIIEEIMREYGIEPSNYIVDILYEALVKTH